MHRNDPSVGRSGSIADEEHVLAIRCPQRKPIVGIRVRLNDVITMTRSIDDVQHARAIGLADGEVVGDESAIAGQAQTQWLA